MRNRGAFSVYIFLSGMSSLCYSMVFSISLAYQMEIVRLNPLQLVLVGALQQSVNFLFQAPTGILADMYSRRRMIVLGFCLVGIGYLIEGCIPAFAAILVGSGIGGLGATLVSGADAAWVADELEVERVSSAYIRGAQAGSIGSLLGIGISAILVNVHLNLPIILSGSLFIVLSITLALTMSEQHFIPKRYEDDIPWRQMQQTLREGIRLVRLRPALLTILGTGICFGMFSAGFDRLWPYHLLYGFTFPTLGKLTPAVWFCIIEAGIVVTNWIGIEIVRRCIDTNSYRAVAGTLLTITSSLIICVCAFALAGQFTLALTMFWLFTTAVGPRGPLEQAWMNQHLESSVRATVFSLRGQVSAIAQIIGGPILGLVATAFNARVALIVAGIMLSPALLLYTYTIRRTRLQADSATLERASSALP